LWFGQAHRKTQISERKRCHKTTKSPSKLKSLIIVGVNGNKTGFVIIHFQTTAKINLMQDLYKEQQLRLHPLHDDNSVINILDYWKGQLCILRERRKEIAQMILETTRISANGTPNLSTSVVVPGGLPRAIPVSAIPKIHTER
jgi:hypothetical protein